jgi:hypothetical protein
VYDTTVLRPFGARDSSAITQRDPRPEAPGSGEPGAEAADRGDDILAAILITNWTLATGRTLARGHLATVAQRRRPDQLLGG